MMKIVYRILPLLFLVIFIGVVNTGHTAEKWALLVGINNYQNDISQLRFCVSDVEAFRQVLVDVAGFKPDKVFLMTDQLSGQNQPNHINIIKRLGILANRIQPDDTFVFYFSGHGISRDGQSFLLATNSDSTTDDTLEVSAVSLQKVSQILSRIKAQQLLTIIDACRNNPNTGRGDQDNLLSDEFTRGIRIKRSSDGSGKPNVSATLYACNIGERAYEWAEKKHGVFSYYLLEGLKGKAANADGDVTIAGLADYTQQKVADWAQTNQGKKQTPWLSLQGGAKLILAENVIPDGVETFDTQATLFVSSIPQGAIIYINQQKMAEKTPAVLRVDTGISRQKEIEVGLELKGYETLVMRAKLVGGQLVELKNLQLVKRVKPSTGSIRVSSKPSGAQIFLDGIQQPEKTPTTLKELVTGLHSIKLTLSDYQDYQRQIKIETGQVKELAVDLVLLKPDKPKPAKVKRAKWSVGRQWPWILGAGIATAILLTNKEEPEKTTTLRISVVIP